jgi:hypothetical protein
MNKTITIHQPDFMPWLGFFNKVNNANELIVLDHVTNNPKAAELWCRRVKMLIGGKEHWMSITIKKGDSSRFIPINNMEINMDNKTVKKFIHSVELNFKRAPFFSEVFYLIDGYFNSNSINLVKKNMWFIVFICIIV